MFIDPSIALGCILGVNSATTSSVRDLTAEIAALRHELNGTAPPPSPSEPSQAEINAWLASPAGQRAQKEIKRKFDTFVFGVILILGILVALGCILPKL